MTDYLQEGREMTRVCSNGSVKVSFSVITKEWRIAAMFLINKVKDNPTLSMAIPFNGCIISFRSLTPSLLLDKRGSSDSLSCK